MTLISTASEPIDGNYDIMFNDEIYSSIPAKISASNLADLLQSFPAFGYVSVSKTGECARYAYTIEWLSYGNKPPISIASSTNLIPLNTPITVTTLQDGRDENFVYNLPNDILRTYHRQPQVSVELFVCEDCSSMDDLG